MVFSISALVKKASEHDPEIPQSHTTNQPTAPSRLSRVDPLPFSLAFLGRVRLPLIKYALMEGNSPLKAFLVPKLGNLNRFLLKGIGNQISEVYLFNLILVLDKKSHSVFHFSPIFLSSQKGKVQHEQVLTFFNEQRFENHQKNNNIRSWEPKKLRRCMCHSCE